MRAVQNARAQSPYGVELVAFSSAYPTEVITNDEYLRRAKFTPLDGWQRIADESGIRARRWCKDNENTASLMANAIEQLRRERAELAAEIDAVVVASGTTIPVVLPISASNPAAADLAPLALRQLGSKEALGLDLKACYCTGFLRGLEIADALLANPNRRSVMVVAVEQGSRLATASSNRSSFSFMVGDAAGAAIMRRSSSKGNWGLLDYCGYTDYEKLDWVAVGGDARSIIMMGSQAAEASFELFVDCARTLLTRNRVTTQDISWLLPLQTHRALVSRIAQTLDWPEKRILWDAAELGFSGSASIPACLADKVNEGVVKRGDRILALAVGAGLNCAGALFSC